MAAASVISGRIGGHLVAVSAKEKLSKHPCALSMVVRQNLLFRTWVSRDGRKAAKVMAVKHDMAKGVRQSDPRDSRNKATSNETNFSDEGGHQARKNQGAAGQIESPAEEDPEEDWVSIADRPDSSEIWIIPLLIGYALAIGYSVWVYVKW
eukprot:TRINITY_DN1012_c0_g4_i3.p1 TRINITY_DN1012_c0_g4~~TRINITY_DN1012_c0_g4_i3.p1  ORF type:complete len:151 (+),score=27.74 TRINITY_DN1012_c0_g4_i3:345-797(+)